MAENEATEYVTLVSNDGYEFKLLRSAACIAGTIKKALDPMCTTLAPQSNLGYYDMQLLTIIYSWLQGKHAEPR